MKKEEMETIPHRFDSRVRLLHPLALEYMLFCQMETLLTTGQPSAALQQIFPRNLRHQMISSLEM